MYLHTEYTCNRKTCLPNAVFKSVMRSSWVHKVCSSHLLYVPQPLELRSVNDLDQQWVECYIAMYGIIELLRIHVHTPDTLMTYHVEL